MKHIKILFFALCGVAFGVKADVAVDSWKNPVEGSFGDPTQWSAGEVPTNAFYQLIVRPTVNGQPVDTKMNLTTADTKTEAFGIRTYAPAHYVFDGAGETFRMIGRDQAAGDDYRGNHGTSGAMWYPFYCLKEANSGSYAWRMMFGTVATKYEPIFSWTDALVTVDSPLTTTLETTFARGTFDFVPDDVTTLYWEIDNMADLARNAVVFSNATVRMPMTQVYGRSAETDFTVSGGTMTFRDTLRVNDFNSGVAGQSRFTVEKGAQVSFMSGVTSATFDQAAGTADRSTEVRVADEGTVLDFSSLPNVYIRGNSALTVTNGAKLNLAAANALGALSRTQVGGKTFRVTGDGSEIRSADLTASKTVDVMGATVLALDDGAALTLKGTVNVGSTTGPAAATDDLSALTVDGAGTHVRHSGKLVLGAGNYENAAFVQNDGTYEVVDKAGPNGPLDVSVAKARLSTASFTVNGGSFSIVTNKILSNNATLTLGPGNATFVQNGGTVEIGDLYPAGIDSSGTIETEQHLILSNGTLKVVRLYYGQSNAGNAYRKQSPMVSLLGGVLETRQFYVNNSPSKTGSQNGLVARAEADGGTVRATVSKYDLIVGLDDFAIGDRGLTVDTSTLTVYMTQDFRAKDGASSAFLRKIGSGALVYTPSACTLPRIVVEESYLETKSNTVWDTTLVVTNGATFSLADVADRGVAATSVTVRDLIVPNGRIKLDPGDTVVVTGDVDLSGATVTFSSDPTPDQAVSFLTLAGDRRTDEKTLAALRRLTIGNALPTGKHAVFALDYAGGRTTVRVTVKDDSEPFDAESTTTWTGAAGWSSADAWSKGVPTALVRAAFAGATPADVAVPAGATVGALSFGGADYTLSGTAALNLAGDKGASAIAVASGAQTLDVPVSITFPTPVTVAANAALTFAKTVTDGSIAKTGKGRLVLDAANAFKDALTLGGGLNVIGDGKALANGAGNVTFTDDTLVFTNDGPMTVAEALTLKSSVSKTNALIVTAEADVTLEDLTVSSGAFMKRGPGRLTIVASATKSTVLNGGPGIGTGNNADVTSTQIDFADDGSAPSVSDRNYGGFNVFEGECVIRGEAGAKDVDLKTKVLVGQNVKGDPAAAVQPTLVIDGVHALGNAQYHGSIGLNVAAEGSLVTSPELRIVNGGQIDFPTVHFGSGSPRAGAYVKLTMTNGTLSAINSIRYYCDGGLGDRGVIIRAKDSSVHTTATGGSQFGHYLNGTIDADFDNCFVGGLNEPVLVQTIANTAGEARFRNGSVFAVKGFTTTAGGNRQMTFAFDDAEWRWGGGDYTITTSSAASSDALYDKRRAIRMDGTGVILKPLADKTFTVAMPFKGEGGLVSAGEGTVAFRDDALQFTGLLDIRSGAVDLTASDDLAALTAKGPGILRGGTITRLTLKETLEGGALSGTPVLDGVTTGSVVVDLGHDETDPLDPKALKDLTVATVASSTSVGRWKLAGTGVPKLKGTFAVEGDKVILKSTLIPGMLLIVR